MKKMKRLCAFALCLLASSLAAFNLYAQTVSFPGPELLGRPTADSITVNVVADAAIEAYFEYGLVSGVYTSQTTAVSAAADRTKATSTAQTRQDSFGANTVGRYVRIIYTGLPTYPATMASLVFRTHGTGFSNKTMETLTCSLRMEPASRELANL